MHIMNWINKKLEGVFMQKVFINVASVTFAMKSEKILHLNKIDCLVVKTPSEFSNRGCSYSIVINNSDLDRSKKLLEKNNITINSIKIKE